MSNIPQISIFDTSDYCTPEFSYLQWFYTYSLNKGVRPLSNSPNSSVKNKGACPPFKSTPLLHKKQRGLTPLDWPLCFLSLPYLIRKNLKLAPYSLKLFRTPILPKSKYRPAHIKCYIIPRRKFSEYNSVGNILQTGKYTDLGI